ncbi:MAG TPA: amidohydrolase family protein [Rhodanobacteraceae bacterium]
MRRILPLLLCLFAWPALAAAPKPLLLTHVGLIDGTGSAVQHDMTIAIQGKRVTAVYPSGSQAVPKEADVRDLSGKYVIPGLIDAHVHITDAEPDIAHYKTFLHALLMGGVTGIRDMAGDDRLLQFLASQANSGALASPDIFYVALMAGPTFFKEDFRAQDASKGEPLGFAPWMQAITAKTDIALAVAEAKGTGATGIKLYANLPAALVKAITAEAHRQGLSVWTHATIFPAKPGDAVDAGVDTISHSPYLVWQAAPNVPDDYKMRATGDFEHIKPDAPQILALFDAMKRRGTILDATLLVFKNEAEHHPQRVGAGIMPWSYAVTRLAHQRGVLVDAGTDGAGFAYGKDGPELDQMPSVHQEMALLVEHCGFTPLQAIEAATEIGAAAVGQSAKRGTITPGKLADLVVLDADPSRDIHNTTKIDFVVKNGRIHSREVVH